jgi:hypothetical protein
MSLWIKWLSTTVPAGIVALPLNDVYVPGFTASTAKPAASVTPWRSSNVTAEVAFSNAFNLTDAGGALNLVIEPVEVVINAAATDAVDTAMIALRPATKIFRE